MANCNGAMVSQAAEDASSEIVHKSSKLAGMFFFFFFAIYINGFRTHDEAILTRASGYCILEGVFVLLANIV